MAKSIALVIFGVVLIGYGYSVHSTDENLFQQSLDFTNENILETRDLVIFYDCYLDKHLLKF